MRGTSVAGSRSTHCKLGSPLPATCQQLPPAPRRAGAPSTERRIWMVLPVQARPPGLAPHRVGPAAAAAGRHPILPVLPDSVKCVALAWHGRGPRCPGPASVQCMLPCARPTAATAPLLPSPPGAAACALSFQGPGAPCPVWLGRGLAGVHVLLLAHGPLPARRAAPHERLVHSRAGGEGLGRGGVHKAMGWGHGRAGPHALERACGACLCLPSLWACMRKRTRRSPACCLPATHWATVPLSRAAPRAGHQPRGCHGYVDDCCAVRLCGREPALLLPVPVCEAR